jgi:hypothetical protein
MNRKLLASAACLVLGSCQAAPAPPAPLVRQAMMGEASPRTVF